MYVQIAQDPLLRTPLRGDTSNNEQRMASSKQRHLDGVAVLFVGGVCGRLEPLLELLEHARRDRTGPSKKTKTTDMYIEETDRVGVKDG